MDSNVKSRVAFLRQQRTSAAGVGDKVTHRLNSLIKISQALSKAVSLEQLAELVAREVSERLQADQTFVLLQDAQETSHIRAEFSRVGGPNRAAVSQSICDTVLTTGDDILIPEALSHPLFQAQHSVVALNLRSVMAVPLTSVGQTHPIGVLYTCSYTTGELFGQSDLELFKAFAAQVSIHLDRTRVLTEKDRLLRELQVVAASRRRVVEVATHELSTPVQQIILALAVAQKQLGQLEPSLVACLNGSLEALLEMLESAVSGANGVNQRFIQPLRNYYQLELQLDQLRPTGLTDEKQARMRKTWRAMAVDHQVELFDHLPINPPVDTDLFERAVTNVLQNAISYSPAGSSIRVEALKVIDKLVIRITDQGIGIPAANLPHIGTWLYRGDNVANLEVAGLGIGLHVTRRIVEAHGGQLSLESQLGQGTQVELTFPALVGMEESHG